MRLNEKDHLTKLLGQLEVHASRWWEIGTYLGFRQRELEVIHGNPILFSQLSYLSKMLSNWLLWTPGDGRGSKDFATLEALKHAVGMTGLKRAASKLTV